MEFLRPSRRRTVLSETVYVLLNVVMAIAVLGLVLAIENPLPAFLLILLSKWRVLAVRPQYWLANIVANAIDMILGLSFVIFLYAASGALAVQIALTILYIGWLLLLKPRSKRRLVVLQAGIGVFFGVTALMHVSHDWWASAVVIMMWIIGYTAARHVLTAYKEPHFALLSLVWGLVVAEIGWMTYHWNFAYDLRVTGDLQLSQAALIVLLISFLAERTYASYHRNKEIRFAEILLPLLLTVSSIGLLLTVFNTISI